MTSQPNVVLVITDDQGYADLGCTGNPWLETPYIDAFSKDAVRCHDFHVSPLCTPTRGALMTGRYPLRNGAWATAWGRSILKRDELTMADVFRHNGYTTGLFGKWHLGDTYPYRPQDRGFDKVVAHKGGGVGQTPDYWGNNYFDDTYFHNSEPVPHEGYCTDIWFDEAQQFITECNDTPFLAVISTNAPHTPYFVDSKYAERYRNNPDILEPEFYGMITNIDENFGKLRTFLHNKNLHNNTILIFMTDNGSSGGARVDEDGFVIAGYNAGMRGIKGSYYEGGHRVPFFMQCPNLGLVNRDVTNLVNHIDLLPTFMELCELELPQPTTFDGVSIAPSLQGKSQNLTQRTIFMQNNQRMQPPDLWHCAVLQDRWRLIGGQELYDVHDDPEQRVDLAKIHPDKVAELRAAHLTFWDEVGHKLAEPCYHLLSDPAENPTRLDAMDLMGDIAWDQPHVLEGLKTSGHWAVEVEQAGVFEISLRRWPVELKLPICDSYFV
ncbi:MAG: arylsulfatase [Deinococcota bacterium]